MEPTGYSGSIEPDMTVKARKPASFEPTRRRAVVAIMTVVRVLSLEKRRVKAGRRVLTGVEREESAVRTVSWAGVMTDSRTVDSGAFGVAESRFDEDSVCEALSSITVTGMTKTFSLVKRPFD